MDSLKKKDLLNIARNYRKHISLPPRYSKLKKNLLLIELHKHLSFNISDKQIIIKPHNPIPFNIQKKEKKKKEEAKKEEVKAPEGRKLTPEEKERILKKIADAKKKKADEDEKKKEDEEKEKKRQERREASRRIKEEEEDNRNREDEEKILRQEIEERLKILENDKLEKLDDIVQSEIKEYILKKVNLDDLYNLYDTRGTLARRSRMTEQTLRNNLFANVNLNLAIVVLKKTNKKLYDNIMNEIPNLIKKHNEYEQPEIVKKNIKIEKGFEFINDLKKLGEKNRKIDYSAVYGYVSEILSLLFYEKYNLSYPLKTIEIYKSGSWSYDKFIKSLKRGIYAGETLFCAPLSTLNHMNLIIFKVDTREIIRFEPHGAKTGDRTGKSNNQFNKFCEALTKKINKDLDLNKKGKRVFKFVPPSDICPRMPNSEDFKKGFQSMENLLKEKGGFCQLWSMFFMECILRNPDMDIKEIYKNAYETMKDNPQFFLDVIKGYYVQVNELLKDIGFFKKKINKDEIANMQPESFYDKYYKYIKKVNEDFEKKPKKEFTGVGFKMPQIYKRKSK